ncbi:MAG: DUF4178 domain-containing protein [Gemmobacter sp.]
MTQHNCPKCGYGLGAELARYRMLNCPSCGTSLFLQDDRLDLAGEQGVMHDSPLLFGLGDEIGIGGQSFRAQGHARYGYGRGTWDEFWVVDGHGGGRWISVDEGDVVVQRPLGRDAPDLVEPPALGSTFTLRGDTFTVTEFEQATCVALRGNFPERLHAGETYRFINATGRDGTLLSGEFGDGTAWWYRGDWVDPFAVRVTRP